MPNKSNGVEELRFLAQVAEATSRRKFIKWSGLTIAVTAVGCRDNTVTNPRSPGLATGGPSIAQAVSLGTGDIAVLNYALALEQLEAEFYTQLEASPAYAALPANEQMMLEDIGKHERIHREFLFEALGPAAIPVLEFDFTSVDFTSRSNSAGNGILDITAVLEDVGVSAYNGAGKLLSNLDFLVIAGKIVSVEARHAAAARDLLNPGTAAFAGDDVVDANGLDLARDPADVLPLADPFIVTEIDASGLPTA